MNQPRDLPGLEEVKQLLAKERDNDAFVFLVEGERKQFDRPKRGRRRSLLRRLVRKMGER